MKTKVRTNKHKTSLLSFNWDTNDDEKEDDEKESNEDEKIVVDPSNIRQIILKFLLVIHTYHPSTILANFLIDNAKQFIYYDELNNSYRVYKNKFEVVEKRSDITFAHNKVFELNASIDGNAYGTSSLKSMHTTKNRFEYELPPIYRHDELTITKQIAKELEKIDSCINSIEWKIKLINDSNNENMPYDGMVNYTAAENYNHENEYKLALAYEQYYIDPLYLYMIKAIGKSFIDYIIIDEDIQKEQLPYVIESTFRNIMDYQYNIYNEFKTAFEDILSSNHSNKLSEAIINNHFMVRVSQNENWSSSNIGPFGSTKTETSGFGPFGSTKTNTSPKPFRPTKDSSNGFGFTKDSSSSFGFTKDSSSSFGFTKDSSSSFGFTKDSSSPKPFRPTKDNFSSNTNNGNDLKLSDNMNKDVTKYLDTINQIIQIIKECIEINNNILKKYEDYIIIRDDYLRSGTIRIDAQEFLNSHVKYVNDVMWAIMNYLYKPRYSYSKDVQDFLDEYNKIYYNIIWHNTFKSLYDSYNSYKSYKSETKRPDFGFRFRKTQNDDGSECLRLMFNSENMKTNINTSMINYLENKLEKYNNLKKFATGNENEQIKFIEERIETYMYEIEDYEKYIKLCNELKKYDETHKSCEWNDKNKTNMYTFGEIIEKNIDKCQCYKKYYNNIVMNYYNDEQIWAQNKILSFDIYVSLDEVRKDHTLYKLELSDNVYEKCYKLGLSIYGDKNQVEKLRRILNKQKEEIKAHEKSKLSKHTKINTFTTVAHNTPKTVSELDIII